MSSIKREILFEGREKRIYKTDDEGQVIIHYTDMATAFGGIKRAKVLNKGKYNCLISAIIFETLSKAGVRNHYIKTISDREQLCSKVDMIPLQFIVRNRLAGTTAELLGVENGTKILNTVYEMRLNDDALSDPMINRHHAVALGILSYEELETIFQLVVKTNEVLKELFAKVGIELIDFKTEFGKTGDGTIVLADEISPDNTRLWDIETGEILDKDRFRHDYGDVSTSYKEVAARLSKLETK